MSWMTPEYIMDIFKENEDLRLSARDINERLGNELTSGALNRHLRRLSGARFGFFLGRSRENGGYVYYRTKRK